MSDVRVDWHSRLRLRVLACALLGALTGPVFAAPDRAGAPDADRLLAESDRARGGNLAGLRMNSKVTEYQGDSIRNSASLEIVSDTDNSLVTFVEPARVKGNKLLVRGRNMWFASPDVIKPVPISPRQRMLGDAANGDIAVTRYSRDYAPTLVEGAEGEVMVDGNAVWVLDLRAKGAGVAYDRIRYFIDKKTLLGLRSDFYSVGGDVLKRATMRYDATVSDGGQRTRFLSRMEIVDGLDTSKKTVLEYSNITPDQIPASAFNLSDLTRR